MLLHRSCIRSFEVLKLWHWPPLPDQKIHKHALAHGLRDTFGVLLCLCTGVLVGRWSWKPKGFEQQRTDTFIYMLDMKLTSCLCDATQLPLVSTTIDEPRNKSSGSSSLCSIWHLLFQRQRLWYAIQTYHRRCVGDFAWICEEMHISRAIRWHGFQDFSPGKVGGRWPEESWTVKKSKSRQTKAFHLFGV